MGNFLQLAFLTIVASMLAPLWPHVLQLVKPYAVRAAGVVPSRTWGFITVFLLGMLCRGAVDRLVSADWKWPSLDWLVPDDTDVTPSPTKGFAAIFVRETGKAMTKEQDYTLGSTKIAAYLNGKCVKDDGLPRWRRFDPNQDVSNEPDAIKQLWAAIQPKATSLPCVAIVSGSKVTIHPITTEAETLALLQKAGG